jgi:peptidoglycan hydrolase CwlO-like protein
MQASRRRLLLLSSAAVGRFFLPFAASAQNPVTSSRGRRPDGSEDPADSANPTSHNSTKAILEERQKNIKKEVERLYDLAADLKAEVEKTDATTTLSLAMLKKAEEIEKLAKQIKDHAKG